MPEKVNLGRYLETVVLKLAAILFFSSPGELLEMVYSRFINSLTASRGIKSETVSEFRTDEKWGI